MSQRKLRQNAIKAELFPSKTLGFKIKENSSRGCEAKDQAVRRVETSEPARDLTSTPRTETQSALQNFQRDTEASLKIFSGLLLSTEKATKNFKHTRIKLVKINR